MIKKIAVIILAMIMIMVTLSPASLAVEGESDGGIYDYMITDPVEDLWQEAGCYMVWALLDSWGIDIQVGEVFEWSDAVYDVVSNLVLEFLDELPSPMSINYWISPWYWSSDFWGNFAYNSSMLEDVDTFADWLKTKFGITNNSTIIIDHIDYIGDAYLYQFNTYYAAYDADGNQLSSFTSVESYTINGTGSNALGYCVAYVEEYSRFFMVIIASSSTRIQYRYAIYNTSGDNVNGTGYQTGSFRSGDGYVYFANDATFYYLGYAVLPGYNFVNFERLTDLQNYFGNGYITTVGNNKVITSIYNPPSVDPSYTSGDDVIVIGGQPQYQVVNFPQTVTVNNLPVAIMPYSLTNNAPEVNFNEAVLPIGGMVRSYSDGIELITGILYRFPAPLIALALSIISATVVFGAIHLFKEH